jgi:hypothetical protein
MVAQPRLGTTRVSALIGIVLGAFMWLAPGTILAFDADASGACNGTGTSGDWYQDLSARIFNAGFREDSRADLHVDVITQKVTCKVRNSTSQANFTAGPRSFSVAGAAISGIAGTAFIATYLFRNSENRKRYVNGSSLPS